VILTKKYEEKTSFLLQRRLLVTAILLLIILGYGLDTCRFFWISTSKVRAFLTKADFLSANSVFWPLSPHPAAMRNLLRYRHWSVAAPS